MRDEETFQRQVKSFLERVIFSWKVPSSRFFWVTPYWLRQLPSGILLEFSQSVGFPTYQLYSTLALYVHLLLFLFFMSHLCPRVLKQAQDSRAAGHSLRAFLWNSISFSPAIWRSRVSAEFLKANRRLSERAACGVIILKYLLSPLDIYIIYPIQNLSRGREA